MNKEEKKYNLIKFEDGDFSLDVNVSPDEDTVWLTLEEIGLLFERDRSVIGKHIRKIYSDGELEKDRTWAKNARVLSDGRTLLFGKAKSTINEHIRNILKNELDETQVMRKFGKAELSNITTKPIGHGLVYYKKEG